MKIASDLVKELRTKRHWSQEQLGDTCGLSLRTVQRLENSGKASTETIRALAAVFEISPDDLIANDHNDPASAIEAVKACLTKYADFTGTASRLEYWWFFLFAVLAAALATVISTNAYQLVAIVVILPLLAAGTRRLRQTSQSGWWQLLAIVPFGIFVVFFLLAQREKVEMGADQLSL